LSLATWQLGFVKPSSVFHPVTWERVKQSLPKKEARSEAEAVGFVFSLTKNHWCTLESMQEWIEKVNILNNFVIPPQAATLTGDAVILDDTWYKHFFQNHRHS
jgi:hypothetical protein